MEISIIIDPGKLGNPDTDLRYEIPQLASDITEKKLEDNGYDYDDEDKMIVFLSSMNLSENEVRDALSEVFKKLKVEAAAVELKIDKNT